jgi:hypothetical protein
VTKCILILLACTFVACSQKDDPFCLTPDLVGTWEGDFYKVSTSAGPDVDTTENIHKMFLITFESDHIGHYNGTSRQFRWYVQCAPKILFISEEAGSSGQLFKNEMHKYSSFNRDSVGMVYHYASGIGTEWRFTRIKYVLRRQ